MSGAPREKDWQTVDCYHHFLGRGEGRVGGELYSLPAINHVHITMEPSVVTLEREDSAGPETPMCLVDERRWAVAGERLACVNNTEKVRNYTKV